MNNWSDSTKKCTVETKAAFIAKNSHRPDVHKKNEFDVTRFNYAFNFNKKLN